LSHQKLTILHAVHEQDPQAKVILFGSRTKDDQRGGGIDLLVISDQLDFRKQWKSRRDIPDEIGWQKLDLLGCPTDQLGSGIARLAIESGISLCTQTQLQFI
jgi:hypothetical protein